MEHQGLRVSRSQWRWLPKESVKISEPVREKHQEDELKKHLPGAQGDCSVCVRRFQEDEDLSSDP